MLMECCSVAGWGFSQKCWVVGREKERKMGSDQADGGCGQRREVMGR